MSLRDLAAKGDASREMNRRPLVGLWLLLLLLLLFVVLGAFEAERDGVAGILHLGVAAEAPSLA